MEHKLNDKYNPKDERYKHLIGKKCILPLMNKEIPIIADPFVDMEFGTGCVKLTPFGTNLMKCLKNKRLRELIISYINQNRKEYVAC